MVRSRLRSTPDQPPDPGRSNTVTERYTVNLNVHEIESRADAEPLHQELSAIAFRLRTDLGVDASVVAVKWGPDQQEDDPRWRRDVAERRMDAIVRDRDQVEAELREQVECYVKQLETALGNAEYQRAKRVEAETLADARGKNLTACENERRSALVELENAKAEQQQLRLQVDAWRTQANDDAAKYIAAAERAEACKRGRDDAIARGQALSRELDDAKVTLAELKQQDVF
jgi:hypothetical protein